MCSLTPRQRAPYAMAIASTQGERETRCAPRGKQSAQLGKRPQAADAHPGTQRARRPTRNKRAPRGGGTDERRKAAADRRCGAAALRGARPVRHNGEGHQRALRRGAVAVLPLLPQQAGGHLRRHRRLRERLHRVAAVLERAPHPRRYRGQPGGCGHRHARGRLRALQLPPRP